jgi:flagellin-like hook-associated protein FlgL
MFQFIKRVLSSNRGTASELRSTSYQNYDILGRPFRSFERFGEVITISDEHTVGAGTYVVGTTETASGTVKLFVHRAGWKCIAATMSSEAAGASAGAGVTAAIGDGTTADKYITALDVDAANISRLNATGHHYKPTTDKIVILTWSAVIPVATKKIFYTFQFVA